MRIVLETVFNIGDYVTYKGGRYHIIGISWTDIRGEIPGGWIRYLAEPEEYVGYEHDDEIDIWEWELLRNSNG